MPSLQWVTRFDAWQALAEEWNHLLARSTRPLPFLRHEYLTTWWETLGAGEWSRGELAVAVYRDGQGRLQGAAPLFITQTAHGPTMMLVGSHRLTDYLDLLVTEEAREPFLHALGEALFGPGRRFPHVRRWEWWNLLPDAELRVASERWSRTYGLELGESPVAVAAYVPLPPSWEAYLHQVGKKQRHEIRRKIRRLHRHHQPSRWYRVTRPERLDEAMEAFFALMRSHSEKAAFFTPARRAWLKAVARQALERGWLFLAFLEIGGEKAAAFLCFDFHRTLWVYNSGLNPKFRQLSPGWVLLAYILQWAIARKYAILDFMRGAEGYKFRFGARRRNLYWTRLRLAI